MKGFAANEDPLKLLEEREAIHLLLPQTTSEKIHKNYAAFTINPSTRYPNLSGLVPLGEVAGLYDTGTGPIRSIQRTQPVATKAERRPVLAEATNRKRSKDDLMIQDRISDLKDVFKKPRVVDTHTDKIKSEDTLIDPSITEPHSPKPKPKSKNVKSEGRSFFRPALKPKPTITFSNDSHLHKITHKKKIAKQFPMDNSVTLLSHTKLTNDSSGRSSSGNNMDKTEHPSVSTNKSILPSSSYTVNAAAPAVSGYSSSHGRDRSPPHNEVNVLKMKASFEKRDLEARNSSFSRQRFSRRSTTSSTEISTTKIPKSASFSDMKDTQLGDASAFPSSKSKTNKDNAKEPNEEKLMSVKDRKQQPATSKQTEKSSFMKWLKEPRKQVAALVASLTHSSGYSPKDCTDCSNVDEASYKILPEDNDISTIHPVTPLVPSSYKEASFSGLDISEDIGPEKQDVLPTFTSQESLPTEDQVNKAEENTAKTDGDDITSVQPLIAKLEPFMVSVGEYHIW